MLVVLMKHFVTATRWWIMYICQETQLKETAEKVTHPVPYLSLLVSVCRHLFACMSVCPFIHPSILPPFSLNVFVTVLQGIINSITVLN